LEVCEQHDTGDDKLPAFPVFADPVQGDLSSSDLANLRSALSWMGWSTPDSLEECAAVWPTMMRNLVRAVDQHKAMRVSAEQGVALPAGIAELAQLRYQVHELSAYKSKIEGLASCGTTQSFLSLPDEQKAKWFARYVVESSEKAKMHKQLVSMEAHILRLQGTATPTSDINPKTAE
jgi:hypothetical protein